MRITILNGNPDPCNEAFEGYLAGLASAYEQGGHAVQTLNLRDMDIRYCLGCWACWVKNPGVCIVKDGSADVCRAVIQSDLTVFTSPVIMGTTSALLKKAQDKLIPLILPYIEMDRGECHHVARYDKYPALGLLLQRNDADDEDLEIITNLFRRMAINFKSKLVFSHTTDDRIGEVAHEADCI